VPTIQSYSKTFLETYVPTLTKPSARRASRQILAAHVVPTFGRLRLDEIRQEHVDRFVTAEKARGMAVKSINNRLSVLSRLLRYAIENGVASPPSVRLRCKIAGLAPETVSVPLDQVKGLLDAAEDDVYRVAVLLAVEAGLRAGEIRGLQWGDIRDGQITVRRALDKQSGEVIAPKHDKIRVVPLSPRLESALDTLPRRGIWVVSRPDGSAVPYSPGLLTAIAGMYERAELDAPPSPIHCLRHTFGTTMAAAGVPLPVLQELMGHADVKTTRRYVHVNERQKREAIASVWQQPGSGVAAAWQRRGSKRAD